MTESLVILTVVIFCALGFITAAAGYARYNYSKFVTSEKELINNIVSLVNTRNTAINTYLATYIEWLNNEFNKKCIELFMADTFLLTLKEKYSIPDSEYVLSFQNIIGDVQNLNRIKTQELMNNVSNSMVEAVKKQIGEK